MKLPARSAASATSRPRSAGVSRRGFLKKSLSTALAAPLVLSLEEKALAAVPKVRPAAPGEKSPMGKLGKLDVSRLICGGNLISGYAHSRDLTYVSSLLRHYFTEEKIFETWARCEEFGINTMVASSSDPRVARLYREYVKRGGKIQYIAQVNPKPEDMTDRKSVV